MTDDEAQGAVSDVAGDTVVTMQGADQQSKRKDNTVELSDSESVDIKRGSCHCPSEHILINTMSGKNICSLAIPIDDKESS